MRRKNLKFREYYYHIVGKTVDGELFPINRESLWDILILQLNVLTLSMRIRVRALVQMENHFHLLISSHLENEELVCRSLQEGIHRMSEHEFLDDLKHFKIVHPIYYQYAYKYIYRNPVTAGICQRVDQYHFSSLNNVLGKKSEIFLLFDNMNLIHDPERVIAWLNEPLQYPPNDEQLNQLFGELGL